MSSEDRKGVLLFTAIVCMFVSIFYGLGWEVALFTFGLFLAWLAVP